MGLLDVTGSCSGSDHLDGHRHGRPGTQIVGSRSIEDDRCLDWNTTDRRPHQGNPYSSVIDPGGGDASSANPRRPRERLTRARMAADVRVRMVETMGFEPTTPSLQAGPQGASA